MSVIQTRSLSLEIDDFSIGKILSTDQGELLLFDTQSPQIIRLSDDFQIKGRQKLPDLKTVDGLLWDAGRILLTDFLTGKLRQYIYRTDRFDLVLEIASVWNLPEQARIVSLALFQNQYLLLDKNICMIRIWQKEGIEIKTVGSRMGYLSDNLQGQRLGFEYPEDLVVFQNQIFISDSGNQRVLILDERFQLKKSISLPFAPYKFIFFNSEMFVVSDFDRGFLLVSQEHGFLSQIEVDSDMVFYPLVYHPQRIWAGIESKEKKKRQICQITVDPVRITDLIFQGDQYSLQLQLNLQNQKFPEAWSLVQKYPFLMLDLIKCSRKGNFSEPQILEEIAFFVRKTWKNATGDISKISQEIQQLSKDYIRKYKYLANCSDPEQVQIEREILNYQLFQQIKNLRFRFRELHTLFQSLSGFPELSQSYQGERNQRRSLLQELLRKRKQDIEDNISDFKEEEMLKAVVDYWLLYEEMKIQFPEVIFKEHTLLGEKFLNALLFNFYFSLAELFYQYQKIESFIHFAELEIKMFPDKMEIILAYLNRLFQLKDYERIENLLKKIPDPDKEGVHLQYYRLYLQRQDYKNAFVHLKKELDLNPQKTQLIPQLIRLRQSSPVEIDDFIQKLLLKSEQSIDVFLEVANAYFSLNNLPQAQYYLEKELERFPENQSALILKLKMLMENWPDHSGEVKELLNKINSVGIQVLKLKSRAYYLLKEFESGWIWFKQLVGKLTPTIPLQDSQDLFRIMNYLDLQDIELLELFRFGSGLHSTQAQKEIEIFLSFFKYGLKRELDVPVEKYEMDVYLSNFSTQIIAYNHYYSEMEKLRFQQRWEECLEMAEKMLRYFPGDPQIFCFLEEIKNFVF